MKQRPFRGKNGFTLIELTLAVVISAIIIIPLAMVIAESAVNTLLPLHYQVASSLLEGELERVANLKFKDVDGEGPTSFTGDFSQYSYQVSYYYVDAGDLDTQSASPATAYKRAVITVGRPGFPSVSAVTIATDN